MESIFELGRQHAQLFHQVKSVSVLSNDFVQNKDYIAGIINYFVSDYSSASDTRYTSSSNVMVYSHSISISEKLFAFFSINSEIASKKAIPKQSFNFGGDIYIKFEEAAALDILDVIYGRPGVVKDEAYYLYRYLTYPQSVERPVLQVEKIHPDAVIPYKAGRASDSGLDVTLIGLKEKLASGVELYNTGIKIKPSFGWYMDAVPRSSIIKTGYMLDNSVGIIDVLYSGELLVPLRKVDPSMPDLTLPNRIIQLIPRRFVHPEVIVVDDIGNSGRGAGGFGSTPDK